MAAQGYTNDFSATLTANYTSGGTTLVLNTVSGLPASGLIFFVKIDSEYFKCTSYSSLTLTVVGAQAGSSAANHSSGAVVTACWFLPDVIDGIRSDQSKVNTYANLPASGMKSGDRFRTSDGPYEFVYDGSNWIPFVADSPALTIPITSGWSWDNQGSSTVDTTTGVLRLVFLRSGATSIRAYYRTAPATPYAMTALIKFDISGMPPSVSGTGGDTAILIGFRDGTGKLVTFRIGMSAGLASVFTDKWTTTTSFSALYATYQTSGTNNFVFKGQAWLRIKDDGTNLIFYWSVNGIDWRQFDSELRTNFLTSGPTQIFLGGYVVNSDVCMDVWSLVIA